MSDQELYKAINENNEAICRMSREFSELAKKLLDAQCKAVHLGAEKARRRGHV